jgi:rubredoxin
MPISRRPNWSCAKCRAVHGKKDLENTIRRLRGRRVEEELTGNFRCPKCGTLHAKTDVYAGNHDAPDAPDGSLAEVELLAEVKLVEKDALAPEAITSEPPPPSGRTRTTEKARDGARGDPAGKNWAW